MFVSFLVIKQDGVIVQEADVFRSFLVSVISV